MVIVPVKAVLSTGLFTELRRFQNLTLRKPFRIEGAESLEASKAKFGPYSDDKQNIAVLREGNSSISYRESEEDECRARWHLRRGIANEKPKVQIVCDRYGRLRVSSRIGGLARVLAFVWSGSRTK